MAESSQSTHFVIPLLFPSPPTRMEEAQTLSHRVASFQDEKTGESHEWVVISALFRPLVDVCL